MIKQTLRQSLTMMKQHRLFTGIYIAGTAVSIAITMVLFIVFYINLGNIYPEYHRGEILYITGENHKVNPGKNQRNGSDFFNLDFAEALKSESKHIKAMALYDVYASYNRHPITADGKNIEVEERIKFVSDGWWQVYDYKFIDGKGFTEKEMHENAAVISESLAMQFFASTKVAGREIKINGQRHRIVGVVQEVTQCTPNSYGRVWLTIYNPFASFNTYAIHNDEKHFNIYALAHDGERETMQQEIESIFHRYYKPNELMANYEPNIKNYWQDALFLGKDDGVWDAIKIYIYIILAVLFIPALNLGGMISSRMNSRLVEMGVRRAYGATRQAILSQVLWENMLLTLFGAVAGLLLSFAVVYIFNYRMTTLLDSNIFYNSEAGNQLSAEMLLNPTIFLCALLMCALLNIASALMPILFALRKDITQSLYCKR